MGEAGDEAQEVEQALKEASSECRKFRRKAAQTRKQQLVDSLWETWHTRNLAEAGRLSRQIAGGLYGTKNGTTKV